MTLDILTAARAALSSPELHPAYAATLTEFYNLYGPEPFLPAEALLAVYRNQRGGKHYATSLFMFAFRYDLLRTNRLDALMCGQPLTNFEVALTPVGQMFIALAQETSL